jgi:hypothetical protein
LNVPLMPQSDFLNLGWNDRLGLFASMLPALVPRTARAFKVNLGGGVGWIFASASAAGELTTGTRRHRQMQ